MSLCLEKVPWNHVITKWLATVGLACECGRSLDFKCCLSYKIERVFVKFLIKNPTWLECD